MNIPLYMYLPIAGNSVNMIVSATWGGGAAVVAGETATDTIYLSRTPPYPPLTRAIARKTRRLVPAARGDLVWEDVPEDLQNIPSLTDSQLEQLARAGMIFGTAFLISIIFILDKTPQHKES